ncbi:MAG: hypothetical protein HY815_21395 [Candidatus Riflebacteria bacterium]|nr:hypothetical protein [Candidatus Riflebacteria bacterium]
MRTRPMVFLVLSMAGLCLAPVLRAAGPDLEVVFARGGVKVYDQPARRGDPGSGRDPAGRLRRGDVVWTGAAGKTAIRIGGHTLVEVPSGTGFTVLPRSVEPRRPHRTVDVIHVFVGQVRVSTDWKAIPRGTRVKVCSAAQVRSTEFGPVIVTAWPAGTDPAARTVPIVALDLERALPFAAKPVPFTDKLYAPIPTAEFLAKVKQARERRTAGREPLSRSEGLVRHPGRHHRIIRAMLGCMRTTLSLDDDVAASLKRLMRARRMRMKELVNEALRVGLREVASPSARQEPYRTSSIDLGRCRLGSIDDISEALTLAEGESFK